MTPPSFAIIAMKNLAATIEATLAAALVTAICFSLVPFLPPQQTLIHRDDHGHQTEFVLPADDVRVVKIRRLWESHNDIRPSSDYAVASWQQELASHYAKNPSDDAAASYWHTREQQANHLVDQSRQAMYRDRSEAPNIELGAVQENIRHPNALSFALICGVIAGAIFWIANKNSPTKQIVEFGFSTTPADGKNETTIACDVQRDWFRIKQPWQVSGRRLVLVAMAGLLICVFV